jgi:hypothetical protein
VRLVQFFDLFWFGETRYDDALALLEANQLVPLSRDAVDLAEKKERFASLDPRVRALFGEVAVVCMEILLRKLKAVRDDRRRLQAVRGADGPRDRIEAELRRKANALVHFVSLLDIPGAADVGARLLQMQAQIS